LFTHCVRVCVCLRMCVRACVCVVCVCVWWVLAASVSPPNHKPISLSLSLSLSLCLLIYLSDIHPTVVNIAPSPGEPLNCFAYVAWAPSQPRDRLADEDCVALDTNKQWLVSRCSMKLPYLCELWPGGDQPADTATRLTKCAALQSPGKPTVYALSTGYLDICVHSRCISSWHEAETPSQLVVCLYILQSNGIHKPATNVEFNSVTSG
jgi:hypothetical protein